MGNEHHGEGVGNLGAGTPHDRADNPGYGEGGPHNHAVHEFCQSMTHRLGGCGVWEC